LANQKFSFISGNFEKKKGQRRKKNFVRHHSKENEELNHKKTKINFLILVLIFFV